MQREDEVIRLARKDDLPALRDIERSAGAAFRDLGMGAIADDEPLSIAALEELQHDGRAWVFTDGADHPVAYLVLSVVDGAAHVDQVSVDAAHAGRGLGRALLDAAEGWAREHGCRALTLTTFADVPWNAPYYERLGFRVLHQDEVGVGLRRVEEHERERGLTAWPRVTMRRDVE